MNAKVCIALAMVATAINSAAAIFFVESTAAAGTTTAITLSGGTGTALALGGGLLLLKGLAVGGLALAAASRNRRSALNVEEQEDAAFSVIAAVEPQHCYKRFICDLATGTFPKSENDVMLQLFKREAAGIENAKFDYQIAATLGKQIRSVNACEIRYSCPLSGKDMAQLFN